MYIDPVVRFWIGVIGTILIGVSQGTVVLAGAVPETLVKPLTIWSGILAFIISTILTALNGAATTTSSRLASAASLPEVKSIITTDQASADAGGNKVVTPSDIRRAS